jgi:phospholipid/cholesterol/gamma-HCH transport system substrate-binding protein
MGQNRFIILGLFVLLAMTMFFYLAFQVGNFSLQRGTELTVLFDDATGLEKGGDVKIKGVIFGKVSSLDYKEDRAEVKIRLHREIDIPGDVVARIRPKTLLGENFLELIIPGESTAEPLQAGDVISRSKTAVDINLFVDRMGNFIDKLESMNFTENLSKVVGTLANNTGRMEEMIKNLDQLAVDARDLVSGNKNSLERTIKNLDKITASFGKNAPKTSENLNQVLARLENLTAELENKSPDLAEDLGTTLKHLSIASEKLPETLEQFEKLSGRLDITLDNVDRFFVDDVPELKEIIEHRGIKTKVRIW